MISACQLIGAKITLSSDEIAIMGTGGAIYPPDDVIDTGNSGIVLRFLTALGALSSHPIVLTGDHSIRTLRPMQPLLDALSTLGATAISTRHNGFAPIIVQGPIKGGITHVKGADSQHVSALLIAGVFCPEPLQIVVKDPGEKPWVALTFGFVKDLIFPIREPIYPLPSLWEKRLYRVSLYRSWRF